MKRFLHTLMIFLLIPAFLFGLLSVGYVVYDPFKILYTYDIDSITTDRLNRDFVSTETFLNNYPKQHYNAFIFGSSRSLGYNPNTWKQHIGNDSRPFSFDASNENLKGIYAKLIFLDERDVPIDHVLLLVDTDLNFFDLRKKETNYLVVKHPLTQGNTRCERINFHKAHFLAYLNPRYFISFYGYELLGIDNSFTRVHRSKSSVKVKYPYNWIDSSGFDDYLQHNPDYFDSGIFYPRPTQPRILPEQIGEGQIEMLNRIKDIFVIHNTDYRIILNPLYDQKKYTDSDLRTLEQIFGKENVWDFSGKNPFTESKYNYYEDSHFRIHVGDSILNSVYSHNK